MVNNLILHANNIILVIDFKTCNSM